MPRATYPRLSASCKPRNDTRVYKKSVRLSKPADGSITKASLLRAAWAVVMARYSESEDVTFGATVSGRTVAIPEVTETPGPMIATVPVHISIPRGETVMNYLRQVQNQASEMAQYEQFGLQNISKLDPKFKEACDFTSLLVIQPVQNNLSSKEAPSLLLPVDDDVQETEKSIQNYFSYPLVLQIFLADDEADLSFTYDVSVIQESELDILSHHYNHVVQQLLLDQPIDSVDLSSSFDMQWAANSNLNTPQVIDSCVHELIETQARQQPDAMAIQASDNNFSYAELDNAANILAHYLINSGKVHLNDLVHVCFEKSAWFSFRSWLSTRLGLLGSHLILRIPITDYNKSLRKPERALPSLPSRTLAKSVKSSKTRLW